MVDVGHHVCIQLVFMRVVPLCMLAFAALPAGIRSFNQAFGRGVSRAGAVEGGGDRRVVRSAA